ncbi:MAG: hypothetical protein J6S69_12115 [Proteobacteria bacterium]|nr:hypothetical protein [Pseudomonadota bacterium]
MKKHILIPAASILLSLAISACTQSPEDVRAWMKDKRAPTKLAEFIYNERNPVESKIEAVMVLTERNNTPDLETILSKNLKNDELNKIVAGSIERMHNLLEERPNSGYETRVKDAAYYLLKLEINDENRNNLMVFIRNWLDSDYFFIPIEKAGRVEHKRLFELLGTDSLPIYQKAIERILGNLEEALTKEAAAEAQKKAEGKKYRVLKRPSDTHTATLSTTLQNLEALKLPGADDMVADMFISRIEAQYPNMPRAFVLPFASNTSEKLLPLAKRIVTDPEYKNETLNYYKDVMMATYYRKIQKKAGAEICVDIVQNDKTGYLRWDCMEILTENRGPDGFATLIQDLPKDYAQLKTPEDHPTLLASPSMTFWNSLRVYCTHLPTMLNNQVPLEVFRKLSKEGNVVTRMLSMACLSTLGEEADVALLTSMANDKTDIKEYGMQVVNLGQLSNFSGALLEKRLLNAKLEAEKKAKEEAEKKAKEEADKKAKEAGADAAADATKPADAAAADAAKPADAAADAAKPADAAAPAAAN